jgi:glycosyltransferase involved in cell wall biosynthesis
MKILLLGEYSRLHNSLKEGLVALGHDVTLVGTGDSFKKFPVDLSFEPKLTTKNWLFTFLKKVVFKVTNLNLEETEKGIRFYFLLPRLKDYDVVQLINSNAIETHPTWSMYLLKNLFKQNKKIMLLVCGDETPIIDAYFNGKLSYSILTPLLENQIDSNYFNYSLKYTKPKYRKLYGFVSQNATTIISSDFDYKLPLDRFGISNKLIANPINSDIITFIEPTIEEKIILFLGINNKNALKKGIPFFVKALEIIQQKYPEKVEIITAENIPYQKYIQLYNNAHIVLDMVYAYDQGYNALEAMAKGKVVFTGAEKEFMEYYQLTERVCVNALPDVDALVQELSFFIENPEEIVAMSKRARAFIEKEHHYVTIAQKYVDVWTKN